MPLNWSLPPMRVLQDMFSDMSENALALGLDEALKEFEGRPIRIATMCSGTESPLLALGLIQDGLKKRGEVLNFEHMFSAEIESYKQAFIERNFHPRLLFRDITQIELGKEVYVSSHHLLGTRAKSLRETAYGAKAKPPPPGEVQVLVVGFSCVDVSALNNMKRTLEGLRKPEDPLPGETNATLNAIRRYAIEHRPAVIILENVCSAPWNYVKQMFEQIEYAAQFILVDSKDYYIPQTRQRGYMICINHDSGFSQVRKQEATSAARKWHDILKTLKRPASSPIEDFLLPNNSQVLHDELKKLDVTMEGSPNRGVTEWGLCKGRHHYYREEQSAGSEHPYTHWDTLQLSLPLYVRHSWLSRQSKRVLDTLDIIKLTHARKGIDIEYQAAVLELSQNVDRGIDKLRPGLTGCITPSGSPFSVLGGRPLVGLEVLSLQGLPIDRIHLTLETPKQLQNMAGNAMTTTVVGAALLAAFAAIPKAFKFPDPIVEQESQDALEICKDIPDPSHLETQDIHRGMPTPWKNSNIPFGPVEQVSVDNLIKLANQTRQLCPCEGPSNIAKAKIYQCQGCSTTACGCCKGNPRHEFVPLHSFLPRLPPSEFTDVVFRALPGRLCLSLRPEHFAKELGEGNEISEIVKKDFFNALREGLGQEVRLDSIKRGSQWIITYVSTRLRLELRVDGKSAEWFLLVQPSDNIPGNAKIRHVLQTPIARLALVAGAADLTSGDWELCVPWKAEFDITITGKGTLVKSWRAELGLPEFTHEQVCDALLIEPSTQDENVVEAADSESEITQRSIRGDKILDTDHRRSASKAPTSELMEFDEPSIHYGQGLKSSQDNKIAALDIFGFYQLLPHCGTAHRQLHRRIAPTTIPPKEDLYVFFDVDPYTPERNRMVISTDIKRLMPKEYRAIQGAIKSSSTFGAKKFPWEPTLKSSKNAVYSVKNKWFSHCDVQLQIPSSSDTISHVRVSRGLTYGGDSDTLRSCHQSSRIFASRIKWTGINPVGSGELGSWEVTETNQYHLSVNLKWLMMALDLTDRMDYIQWQVFPISSAQERCRSCAPVQPSIRWRLPKPNETRTASALIAYEDASQAGPFERAWKSRPSPITVRICLKEADDWLPWATIDVDITPITLIHRALAQLPYQPKTGTVNSTWRLDIDPRVNERFDFRSYRLKSNQDDEPCEYYFPGTVSDGTFSGRVTPSERRVPSEERALSEDLSPLEVDNRPPMGLRTDQARSLAWMLSRDGIAAPTYNEEVLEESMNRAVNWRLEAKVVRQRQIRGGILADHVGYGKTVTIIALIRATMANAVAEAKVESCGATFSIPTKATLIVVPPTLVHQWASEIQRFWPGCKLVVLESNSQTAKCSISMIQDAEVVLVASTLLGSSSSLARLSSLAALPQPPGKNVNRPREFQAWLATALGRLQEHVNNLLENGPQGFENFLIDKYESYEGDWENYNPRLSKRLVGTAFQKDQAAKTAKATKATETSPVKEGQQDKVKAQKSRKGDQQIVGLSCNRIADVTGIVLHLFKFHRKVVDEQTYMSAVDMKIITAVQSRSSWLISATPSLSNFGAVQRLANYLGFFLGVEDYCSFKTTKGLKSVMKDKTDAERFQMLQVCHSSKWHSFRHDIAQSFLDEFLRRNTLEDAGFSLVEHFVPIRLSPSHQLVYAELQGLLLVRGTVIHKIAKDLEVHSDRLDRMIKSSEYNCSEVLLQAACYDPWVPNSNEPCEDVRTAIQNSRNDMREAARLVLQNQLEDLKSLSNGFTPDGKLKWQAIKSQAGMFEPTTRLQVLQLHENDVELLEKEDAVRKLLACGAKKDVRLLVQNDQMALQTNIRTRCARALDYADLFSECIREERAYNSMSHVQNFLSGGNSTPVETHCGCGGDGELVVNALCGHILCKACIDTRHTCGVQNCPLGVVEKGLIRFRELHSPELRSDPSESQSGRYPRSLKLEAMVKIIKATDEDDQVIVFSQLDEVTKEISGLFDHLNIPHLAVKEVGVKQRDVKEAQENLEKFRTRQPIPGWRTFAKALILNPSDSTAAGHNLPNASTVIFVSPLLAQDAETFQAAYTQAIGRVRRMGQKKTIHVHHLLMLDTIDIDILERDYGVKLLLRYHDNKETLEVLTTKEEYDLDPGRWQSEYSQQSLMLGSRPYRIGALGEDEFIVENE